MPFTQHTDRPSVLRSTVFGTLRFFVESARWHALVSGNSQAKFCLLVGGACRPVKTVGRINRAPIPERAEIHLDGIKLGIRCHLLQLIDGPGQQNTLFFRLSDASAPKARYAGSSSCLNS
jgi:hypothetical protein